MDILEKRKKKITDKTKLHEPFTYFSLFVFDSLHTDIPKYLYITNAEFEKMKPILKDILTPEEAKYVKLRFGFSKDPISIPEIAVKMEVTPKIVTEMEFEVRKKLNLAENYDKIKDIVDYKELLSLYKSETNEK